MKTRDKYLAEVKRGFANDALQRAVAGWDKKNKLSDDEERDVIMGELIKLCNTIRGFGKELETMILYYNWPLAKSTTKTLKKVVNDLEKALKKVQ